MSERKSGRKGRKIGRKIRKPAFKKYWANWPVRLLNRIKRHLRRHPNDQAAKAYLKEISANPPKNTAGKIS